jgi:hypothetical protein
MSRMKSRAAGAALPAVPGRSFMEDIPRWNPFELSRLSAKPARGEQGRKTSTA